MRLNLLATLSLGFLPVCLLAQDEDKPSGTYELSTVVQRGSERVWFQPASRTGFASSGQGKVSGSYAIVYNPERRESIRAKLSVVRGKKVYEVQNYNSRASNPFYVYTGYGIEGGLSSSQASGEKNGVPGTYFGFQNTVAPKLARLLPSLDLKLVLGELPETASKEAIEVQWRQAGSFLLRWLESQGYTRVDSSSSTVIDGPPPAGTTGYSVLPHDYYALPAEQPAVGVWVESSVRATESFYTKETILPSRGSSTESYSWKYKEPWTTIMFLGLTDAEGEFLTVAGQKSTLNWRYARIFQKAGKKYYQLGGAVGPPGAIPGIAQLQRRYLRTRGTNGKLAALELLNSELIDSFVDIAGEDGSIPGGISQSSSNQLWGVWRPLKINDETTVNLPYSMVGVETGARDKIWPAHDFPGEDGEIPGSIRQSQTDIWTSAPKWTLHAGLTREIAEHGEDAKYGMNVVISYLEDLGYVDFDAEPKEEKPIEE